MPDWTPGQRQLLSVYGVIQEGVEGRVGTAELWSAVKGALVERGITPGPFGFQDMNALRSMAAGQRTASLAVERALPGDVIGADMVGRQPWSADLATHNAAPAWEVRYQHTTATEAGTETNWRTLYYEGALPATVGALLGEVEDTALTLATDVYSTAHVGIGDVRISVAGVNRG